MNDDLEARIRSGQALAESMGNFHVTGWSPERKTVQAAFTALRSECADTRSSGAEASATAIGAK